MTLTQINKAGLDELALDHVFTIGASGSSAYTFQGEGLNGTVNNPTLYLTRGKTYRFENGSGGHPIRIQSTSGASGTAYNTGVTNNAGSGTVIVEVQHDAPDVLYYQCTSHAAMNGVLYITGALADGGVTTAKIADDAVTSAKIPTNAILGSKIAADAVTTTKISNSSVTTAKIANSNITTAKINDDAVTLAKMADNSVSTGQIVDNAVTTSKIADSQIITAKINNGAVTGAKLATGAVSEASKIQDAIITGAKIGSGTIAAGNLATNAVTTAKIADGAITSGKIGSGQIAVGNIGSGAVHGSKIAAGAVVSAKIADGAVLTAKIADDAVTAAKLANTSVSAGSYGSSSAIPVITVDAQGRLTAASTASTSSDLVSDTSPQLGGSLDANSKNINFGDSTGSGVNRIRMGASNDLQMYHDTNNTLIDNATGYLGIRSDTLYLQDHSNGHAYITCVRDGAVGLRYDNSEKIKTTSNGAHVNGLQTWDGNIYPNGDNAYQCGLSNRRWSDVNAMNITANTKFVAPNLPVFHAIRGGTNSHVSNNYVNYPQTYTNQGNHFNTSNGRFTAPYHGAYHFYVGCIKGNHTSVVRVYFYKNGSNMGPQLRMDDADSYGDNGSMSFVTILNANDYIQIYTTDGSMHNGEYSYFGGHYLG